MHTHTHIGIQTCTHFSLTHSSIGCLPPADFLRVQLGHPCCPCGPLSWLMPTPSSIPESHLAMVEQPKQDTHGNHFDKKCARAMQGEPGRSHKETLHIGRRALHFWIGQWQDRTVLSWQFTESRLCHQLSVLHCFWSLAALFKSS